MYPTIVEQLQFTLEKNLMNIVPLILPSIHVQSHHFMANRWVRKWKLADFIVLGSKITVDSKQP